MSGKKAAANVLSFVGKVTMDQVKKANQGKGEVWVTALKTASEETKRQVSILICYLDYHFCNLDSAPGHVLINQSLQYPKVDSIKVQ